MGRGPVATVSATVGAFAVYLVAGVVLFGLPVMHAGSCLCMANTTDAGIWAWAMEWWPHAVAHGLNPFFSHLIYAPFGANLAHGQLTPAAGLAMWPLTAATSALTAYNVAMALSPVLAAFFAFLLCRRLTGAFWPSLVGGWLFGFSTYMLGQLTSHLNLTLVFLVPAIVHLGLRLVAGDISRRWFVVLMTLALLAQFGFSPEIFVSGLMFAAVAVAVAWWQGGAETRSRLRGAAGPAALSVGLTALLAAPYLYYAFKPGAVPILPWRTNKFSNDLLSFVVPTELTRVGGGWFLSTSRTYTSGYVEGGAYLGLPLLALVGLAAFGLRRVVAARVALIVLAITALLSLGGVLWIGGDKVVPLPWAAVNHLPVLGQLMPARFVLYSVLCIALLAALWLARRAGAWRWGLALVAIAAIWPAVGRSYWHSKPSVPALFRTALLHRELRPDDTVLVLPVGILGPSMLWHAQAKLGFHMASGYIVPPEAPDPYSRFAVQPTLTYGAPVPHQLQAAASFLRATHTTVAVLDDTTAAGSPWPSVLGRLGWQTHHAGGATILRPSVRPAPGATQAHAVVARFYARLAAADAAGLCTTLTPEARGRIVHLVTASVSACARKLAPVVGPASPLTRAARAVRLGPARLTGALGTVTVLTPGRPSTSIPVRLVSDRWLVDGTPS